MTTKVVMVVLPALFLTTQAPVTGLTNKTDPVHINRNSPTVFSMVLVVLWM